MGLTYKENVPDTRESPVREMVKELKEFGCEVYGNDPLLSTQEIERFGVKLGDLRLKKKYDCMIFAVAHNQFKKYTLDSIKRFMNDRPVLVDVRRMFNPRDAKKKGFTYCTL